MLTQPTPCPGSPRERSAGEVGSLKPVRRRAEPPEKGCEVGEALCPRPAQPKTKDSSPISAKARAGVWGSQHAPTRSGWGCWAGRVKVPVRRCLPVLGAGYRRITAIKERLVLRPVVLAAPHLSPISEPAESSMHYARKTAARVGDAARQGRERGATGAGTAPALSAVHLPIPRLVAQVEDARGEGCGEGAVPKISAWTEELPPPAKWDGPRRFTIRPQTEQV